MAFLVQRAGLVCLALFLLAACGREEAPAPLVASVTPQHRFNLSLDGQTISARLAVLPAEQQRGLMNTESLPENEGMLFVYSEPQRLSFWMRNTPLQLDIGYFDAAGVLQEIHPLYPHVADAVPSRRTDLQFALEMNRGWFATHGLKPGVRLDLDELADALRQRGFDPRRYLRASE